MSTTGRKLTELPVSEVSEGAQVLGLRAGADTLIQLGAAAAKAVGSAPGQVAAGDHGHSASAIGAVATAAVGAPNGVAGLGGDGKVPVGQLPVMSGGGSTSGGDTALQSMMYC